MHQAHQVAWPSQRPALAAPAAQSWRMANMAADTGPEPVKVARDFTGETLQAWGLRALSTDAAVVVSELVTNALRYGCPGDGERLTGRTPVERLTGRTELVLWGRTSQLICVVIDSSPLPPVPAPAGFAAE
jgi:hypothetical protein